MLRPNPLFKVYIAEKAAANLVVAAHRYPPSLLKGSTARQIGKPFFSSLLVVQT